MNKKETFAKIHLTDLEAERLSKEWLESRGFKIEYPVKTKRSNKPYDIIAERNGKRWAIEVKTGVATHPKPQINILNFINMIKRKDIDKFGLVLVHEGKLYLLEFCKRKNASIKAWDIRKKKKNE